METHSLDEADDVGMLQLGEDVAAGESGDREGQVRQSLRAVGRNDQRRSSEPGEGEEKTHTSATSCCLSRWVILEKLSCFLASS